MTDVIVMVLWQVLLPYICLFYGRCYCHVVIDRCCCQFNVEDVKPHHCFSTFCSKCEWLMLLPSGRCSGHCRLTLYNFDHRAQVICSSPELLQQEEKHLHQALTRCKYPEWVLDRAKVRAKASKNIRQNNNTNNNVTSTNQRPYMVIPYYKV